MPKKLEDAQLADLEEKVVKLQAALESWQDAGIPRHTLVVLLNHYTKVPQRTIKLVFEGIDALYESYFTEDEYHGE